MKGTSYIYFLLCLLSSDPYLSFRVYEIWVYQPSDVSSGIPNRNLDLVDSINLSDFLPSGRGFKIAGLNINSLIKHIDELRILLDDHSVDILSINETKLDDSIKSCGVQISGYEFIRRDRNRQGGVGFYIKTSINNLD